MTMKTDTNSFLALQKLVPNIRQERFEWTEIKVVPFYGPRSSYGLTKIIENLSNPEEFRVVIRHGEMPSIKENKHWRDAQYESRILFAE